MEDSHYVFQIPLYDIDKHLSQVSQVLEKRTELLSRQSFPKLWKATDKLNRLVRKPESVSKRQRVFRKMSGGLLLVMGIFLVVPGMVEPKELTSVLVIGIVSFLFGIFYLKYDGSKKDRFEKPALMLLENLNDSVSTESEKVVITGDRVLLNAETEEGETVSFENVLMGFETEDLFCLTFDTRIVILQKKEILEGTVDAFRELLSVKLGENFHAL